jgi:hypothetical protein
MMMMMMMMVAEELQRENVTARSQVRDDGRTEAHRAGRSEASGGGDFLRVVDIYYQDARDWSRLGFLVSLRCRSRVGAAHLSCVDARCIHERDVHGGRQSRQALLAKVLFSSPPAAAYKHNHNEHNSKHALTINQPDNNQLKCSVLFNKFCLTKIGRGEKSCATFVQKGVQNTFARLQQAFIKMKTLTSTD